MPDIQSNSTNTFDPDEPIQLEKGFTPRDLPELRAWYSADSYVQPIFGKPVILNKAKRFLRVRKFLAYFGIRWNGSLIHSGTDSEA